MRNFTEQIKGKLGPDLYGRALGAYGSSPAAEDDELLFSHGLAQAAYAFVQKVREVLPPETLALREEAEEENTQEKQIGILSQLIYGMLRLDKRDDTTQAERFLIIEVLQVIFKNPSIFVLSDEHGDNYTLFNLLEQIETFYSEH